MKHLLTALALLFSCIAMAQENKAKVENTNLAGATENTGNNTSVTVIEENGTVNNQPGFNNYVIKTKTIFSPRKKNLRKAISAACDCDLDATTSAGNTTTNPITIGSSNGPKSMLDIYGNVYQPNEEHLRFTETVNEWSTVMGITADDADFWIRDVENDRINLSILKSGGEVGIGMTNPSYLLHVNGQGKFNDRLYVTTNPSDPNSEGIVLLAKSDGGGAFYIKNQANSSYRAGFSIDQSNNVRVSNYINTGSTRFWVGGADKMVLTSNGDIGLGTISPSTSIDVRRNVNASTGMIFENTNSTGANAFAALQIGQDITGGTRFANFGYANAGVMAFGGYKPQGTFLVNNGSGGLTLGTATPNTDVRFYAGDISDAGHRMVIKGNTGFVGIGNTSPSSLLDVGNATTNSMVLSGVTLGAQIRTLSNTTSAPRNALNVYIEQDQASTSNTNAIGGISLTSNSSGTVALSIGTSGSVYHAGTGTLTTGRAMMAIGWLNSTGTVTNMMGYETNFVNTGGGTITNAYGLRINTFPTGVTNKFGVYVNDATAYNYFAGSVGIGTTNATSGYKLAVDGDIKARKLKITQTLWPDYVFDKKYKLLPLKDLEKFILANKHLPGVPSAGEVQKEGLDVGETQGILLKKIEELTLYLIQQNQKILELEQELTKLKKKAE